MTETDRDKYIKALRPDHIIEPIYYSSVLNIKPQGMFSLWPTNIFNINQVPIPKKWYKNDTSGYKDNRCNTTTLKITEKKFNEELVKELQKRQRVY